METSELYTLAEEHHHEVISCRLRESPAFSVEDQNGCHIALSDQLTETEEKTKLAHELGHCEYGGFYNYHSRFDIRQKAENKANKWSFIHVLPLTEIYQALQSGCRNIYELADYFRVEESFMHDALLFYADQIELDMKSRKGGPPWE